MACIQSRVALHVFPSPIKHTLGIPLSQVSDCQCSHSSGSHCRHPGSIHKGKFLSGHGIEEHYATFQRRHPVRITVNHLHAIDLLVRNIRRHCIHKDIVRKVDADFAGSSHSYLWRMIWSAHETHSAGVMSNLLICSKSTSFIMSKISGL